MYTFRLLHAIQQKSQCKYTHYTHSSSSSNSSSSIVYINTPYRIVQTFADSIYITHIRIYVRRIVVTNKSSRLCQLTSISPFNVFSLFRWKRFNADSIGTDRYVECFWFTLLLLFYVVNLMIRLKHKSETRAWWLLTISTIDRWHADSEWKSFFHPYLDHVLGITPKKLLSSSTTRIPFVIGNFWESFPPFQISMAVSML